MLIPLVLAILAAAPADGAAAHDTDRAALRKSLETVVSTEAGGGNFALRAEAGETLKRWADRNRPALDGIGPSGLREQPWGLTAAAGVGEGDRTIYLYVFDWHVSGRLVVYGLGGGVTSASLLDDPDRKPLPVETVGKSMVVTVPKAAPDPLATVVVLRLSGKAEVNDLVARAAGDGRVVLHARDAVVHGRTLRYEPEPHKDTVGYWTDPKDWASWEFEVDRPGTYRVEILQGCGKGSGGSTVDFGVGGQVLRVVVEDTGGFQNFAIRSIGVVRFGKAGRFTLTAKPADKPGVAVMDLRQVTLVRVGE